jgi:hypothetical protein
MSLQSQLFTGVTTDWRTEVELSGFLFVQMRHCAAGQTVRQNSARTRHGNQVMLNTSDTVRSTQTEDGRIVLDIRRGQMFSLNVVGSRILELIEHGWDEARIAEEISRSYAMSIEVVRTDVHDFIKALRQHEILRVNDSVDFR